MHEVTNQFSDIATNIAIKMNTFVLNCFLEMEEVTSEYVQIASKRYSLVLANRKNCTKYYLYMKLSMKFMHAHFNTK